MSRRRAVVTGLGAVTPIGTGIQKFWDAAVNATNGVQPITSIDTSDFRTKVGGEVKEFSAEEYLDAKSIASMGRASQFAIAAAKMAVNQSGLDFEHEDAYRVGVSMGTTMGEPQVLEQGVRIKYDTSDPSNIPSHLPRQYPCNVISANVARAFGASGQTIMIPTACAAGNYALGYALDMIALNRLDVALVGGSDPFSRIAFTGFNRLLATAKEACRPFDKNRDGMAVGEGAGMLIIEELEHAKKRGATILAEVNGYGLGCDAFKMTIPDPDGRGGRIALQQALKNSELSPDSIDYISAHGTGTSENDKVETSIIRSVLGDRADGVPVSSLKSMLGHTMGAASAIEAVGCVLMIQNNVALPTINHTERDPDCDLDYVFNAAREMRIDTVVSNAYAFGGNCSSIILTRFKD